MLVDPELLRGLAAEVSSASASITAANLGAKVTSGADALPGSTTQWACHVVGGHLAGLAAQLADDVSKMGTAVRGAADTFEVEDDALAGAFDGLF